MSAAAASSPDAALSCGECGAQLEVRAREGTSSLLATCPSCPCVYDLEDLVCAPTEIDALNDEVATSIRQAFE